MRRWAAACAAAVVACVSSLSGTTSIPQFRAAIDAVTVDVSVLDRTKVVTGLTETDFELRDNGVPQTVRSVTYGKLPIDVTVALDVSLSVDGPRLQQLRQAVTQLMRDLRKDDRLSLVTFNNRVSRVMEFTNNRVDVDDALRSVAAGGGTSIWDAAATVLAAPHPADRRHLLVLFTDGADSTSISSPADIISLARRMNTTVSAIVPTAFLGIGILRGPGTAGQAVLSTLAEDTGGQLVHVVSARQNLAQTFQQLLERFRSTYVLHYQPQDVETKGLHAIEVAVRGRPGLAVTARRSYVR